MNLTPNELDDLPPESIVEFRKADEPGTPFVAIRVQLNEFHRGWVVTGIDSDAVILTPGLVNVFTPGTIELVRRGGPATPGEVTTPTAVASEYYSAADLDTARLVLVVDEKGITSTIFRMPVGLAAVLLHAISHKIGDNDMTVVPDEITPEGIIGDERPNP